MKLIILFSVYILFSQTVVSQTLEIAGKQINFGMSEKDLTGTPWQDGGQIESNYTYINVYEGEYVYGSFYNNQLISIDINAYNNEPYPVSLDMENLIANLNPFKQYTKFDGIGIFIELYKTDDFYISRESSRMNTNYVLIPIVMFDDIQKTHPEYLTYFNK